MPNSEYNNGANKENELLSALTEKGYVVYRVAGSGTGEDAHADVVALAPNTTYLIEVKKRTDGQGYIPKQEVNALAADASRCGARAIIAVRRDARTFDEPWQFFAPHQLGETEKNYKFAPDLDGAATMAEV